MTPEQRTNIRRTALALASIALVFFFGVMLKYVVRGGRSARRVRAMAEEPKAASPLRSPKAVLWSFLGIRRRAEHESDLVRLKPVQVIVAGLIGAAIFVLSLVLPVRFVVDRAT